MNPSLLLFLRANRQYVGELLLASVLVNAFVLALPLFSMLVYDKAMGNELHDTLWTLSIGMALLCVLELCLRLFRVLMVEHAGGRWDMNLDNNMLRSILAAPVSKSFPVANVLSSYRELSTSREVLSSQFLLPLADLPFLLLFIVVVGYIGGTLVFIPLTLGGILIFASWLCQLLSQSRLQMANRESARKLAFLVDVLSARESLMAVSAADSAISHYRSPVAQSAKAAASARLWSQVSQQLLPLISTLAVILVLIGGVFRVEERLITVGGLISCNMLSGRIILGFYSASTLLMRWKEFRRALHQLHDVLDMQPNHHEKLAEATNAFKDSGVRLETVSFGYAEQSRLILDSVSVQLNKGQMIAVVGSSGAGKTTLLRLLAGYMQPKSGQVIYGGHRMDSDQDRRWLAAQVSYKSQDPAFLGGSLAQVLSGGREGLADDVLINALRSVGFGPAMDRGDLALNSVIAANGVGLSGGEKQMVALARALIEANELLLLDEPTTGMDRPTQERVLQTLQALKSQHCIVVSTHTTELIQMADRILVIDGGKIIIDSKPSNLKLQQTAAL